MCIGDWNRLATSVPPETPVYFYYPGAEETELDTYFDGVSAELSRYWDWQQGWLPCVTITLQKEVG